MATPSSMSCSSASLSSYSAGASSSSGAGIARTPVVPFPVLPVLTAPGPAPAPTAGPVPASAADTATQMEIMKLQARMLELQIKETDLKMIEATKQTEIAKFLTQKVTAVAQPIIQDFIAREKALTEKIEMLEKEVADLSFQVTTFPDQDLMDRLLGEGILLSGYMGDWIRRKPDARRYRDLKTKLSSAETQLTLRRKEREELKAERAVFMATWDRKPPAA